MHTHKLSWHNYVTQTSADYLNVCWEVSSSVCPWRVSGVTSQKWNGWNRPPHTRAHTTLPRRSNPGGAYTCVYFSTCVLVCYLWWVGLKQISTPLVQFKHTGTILHTTAQLMRDKPEPRKVSDDTSTWLKTEALASPPLSLSPITHTSNSFPLFTFFFVYSPLFGRVWLDKEASLTLLLWWAVNVFHWM